MKHISTKQTTSYIIGWKKATGYKTCMRFKINYDTLLSLIERRQENKKLAAQYPKEYCEHLLSDLDEILCLTEWQKYIDYYGHGFVDSDESSELHMQKELLTDPLAIKKYPTLSTDQKQKIKTFIAKRTKDFCNATNPFILTDHTFEQITALLNTSVHPKIIYKYISEICYCINKLIYMHIKPDTYQTRYISNQIHIKHSTN